MLKWWRRWRDDRARRQRAIPDALWLDTLHRLPFLKRRPLAYLLKLREACAVFLDRHEFHGAGGLVVTDEMAVAVAAQACLPVLHLDLAAYDGFVGIVLHPGEVVAQRQWIDEDGISHEGSEELVGEAMPGGPVMLAWSEVAASGETAEEGYNVVIHEFVHVLDMLEGEPDGIPPLPDAAARRHWRQVMEAAHARLVRQVERDEPSTLDPYGVHGLGEFFPIASETFFVAPDRLLAEEPALYALLSGYYRQDPAAIEADPGVFRPRPVRRRRGPG